MPTPSFSFPVVQGAQSTTFSTPRLDGTLTFPELLAFHAENSGSHTLFAYADGLVVKSVDYATVYRAHLRASSVVKAAFEAGKYHYERDPSPQPVFAILASADSVTFATLIFGIQHTGSIPFPISPRNSAVAVAHLLRTTNTRQVFVSDDVPMRTLASEAMTLLAKDGYPVELLELPRFEDLYSGATSTPHDLSIAPYSVDSPAMILHSSGTSAFPKPIHLSHRTFLSWGMAYYYGEVDICGVRVSTQSTPMFHALGVASLVDALCCGIEIAVFKPSRPPVVVNPETVLQDVVATKSTWIRAVPSLIETWAREPQNVQTLKDHVECVIYGGGPLDKTLGDALSAQGIAIYNFYGSTETGALCMKIISNATRPTEWEYFRLPRSDLADVRLIPYEESEGLSQPVLLAGKRYSPSVFNTSINGTPGYATGDLVKEHPTRKEFFKIYGRVDEQIMLSTGEKTNPVPLERMLQEDPNIHIAVFFGRGRFNNGVLVEPVQPFSPNDVIKVAEFRNLIWPTVSTMNAYAPTHSRLLKEMILIANPEKPLELTAKGTARRNVNLAKYEEEINAIYQAVEDSLLGGPQPPATWSNQSSLDFARSVVEVVMDRAVEEDADLFSIGCDSLGATLIRNNIIRALRASTSTASLARQVPQTLVYQNPSIRALSNFIHASITGSGERASPEELVEQKVREMEAMVSKFSSGLIASRLPRGQPPPALETVLVTGTTGRLGCHLLAQLIEDPKVRHIYALNRAPAGKNSSDTALKRMRASFQLWGLDPALLVNDKVTLLTGDYTEEHLGLGSVVYSEIESRLTTIIHAAWRVDFNVGLTSFEPLLTGLRRLIDLAAGAEVPGGARFVYVSSVSVLLGIPQGERRLEEPVDAQKAVGMGYSESKWVAETVLLRAQQAGSLRAAIVRVGQLAGDTRIGAWNKQEWVGAIARLGQTVKAIPDSEEQISWVPVDVAARALIDIARSGGSVFNLVSPAPADWRAVFGAFAEHLGVPLIPYDEWASRVVAAAETNTEEEDMQSLALANFFSAGRPKRADDTSTAHACEASAALARLAPLGKQDALLYLKYWQQIGHLRA